MSIVRISCLICRITRTREISDLRPSYLHEKKKTCKRLRSSLLLWDNMGVVLKSDLVPTEYRAIVSLQWFLD